MLLKYNRGFTLIELLVVVLIIAILAAVAVPKYRVAVEKSRAMQAVVSVRALSAALHVYYLEHGEYPNVGQTDLEGLNEALDLNVSLPSGFTLKYAKPTHVGVIHKKPYYMISRFLPTYFNGTRFSCNIAEREEVASISSQVCKSLCHTDALVKVWGSGEYGCVFE